jgi:hypothetical protein
MKLVKTKIQNLFIVLALPALCTLNSHLSTARAQSASFSDTNWSALGSGMNSAVHALAVSGTNLIAGGDFTPESKVLANYIAQWNGSAWSALGSGMDNTVQALAVSGTNLFAGGKFTNAGGVPASYIAQWNGSSWSALGSGMSGGSYAAVFALAVSGTNLFAGGAFTTAGGIPASCIAQWNGNAWSPLGEGMNATVWALAVSGTNLFAGGAFTSPANDIAQWNGSSWSALGSYLTGSGMNNAVFALAVSGANLFAAGEFTAAGREPANYVAQWNGSSWSVLGTGLNGKGPDENGPYLGALAVLGNTMFAGGDFSTAGGAPANSIAQWNGSSWSALGSGMNSAVHALAVSGTNLIAGGDFTKAGASVCPYIAQASIAPPMIITQPSGQTLPIGGTVSFGVSATGSWPLEYQWYFDTNSLLTDATNSTLSFLALTNESGSYEVVVSNLFGSVTSTAASLTVSLGPTVCGISNGAGGPVTVYLENNPGSTNRLWATTDLTLPFSQWQVMATNVAGPDGLFEFVDPNTNGVNARFYRLSSP